MSFSLKYRQVSPYIFEIIWPAEISEAILFDILKLKNAIEKAADIPVQNMRITYHHLSLAFDDAIDFKKLKSSIEKLYAKKEKFQIGERKCWEIPVLYEGKDLAEFAKTKKLPKQELIALHSSRDYLLYFFGFLPGFMYLGGLDARLHQARKAVPDRKIEKGSVAIGGKQTGVYPLDSPGGWHVIGQTPIKIFELNANQHVFARAGDIIRFSAIEFNEFSEIESLVQQGKYKIKSKVVNG
ncbi:MAG: 5-oxoprolinase subunit PxpB [Chitinophagales bacterium]